MSSVQCYRKICRDLPPHPSHGLQASSRGTSSYQPRGRHHHRRRYSTAARPQKVQIQIVGPGSQVPVDPASQVQEQKTKNQAILDLLVQSRQNSQSQPPSSSMNL